MSDIVDLSAVELAGLIRDRKVSAVEAVEAALARIAARRELNAFITVTADAALAEARAADQRTLKGEPLPPLHGLPYSVKDLINTAGVRTTMGSAIFADNFPQEDGVAVARAKAAGAILIGKTTTPEFGHKPAGDAPIFGRTLNPIDPSVTCGGSSSGAAVAVAAGMGPFALGTDGGGSIRIPASCCGIVGLKATLGAIPHLQVPDLFAANSYVGPLARDVADTQLLFESIVGPDAGDPYGQIASPPSRTAETLKGVRIAWLPRCGNRLDPEVEVATAAAVRRMEALGAAVETVELDFVSLEPAFLVMLQSQLAARVVPYLAEVRDRLDPSLLRTMEKGLTHSAVDVHNASYARTACFKKLQAIFRRFDLLVSPTLSAPPLPVEQDPHGIVVIDGKPAGTIRGAWYPYTYPMNLTGHPALSMPCGTTRGGLPIGLQIAGRWHDDRFILSVARLLEAAL